MPAMLTIVGKTLGQGRPLFEDWSIPLPPECGADGGSVTLRRLIEHAVREETTAFAERQKQARLVRALSRAEIEAGAERGKVTMGGQEAAQEVDPQAAVTTALLAYEDGLYHV